MNEITENDVISGQILTHSGSQTAVLNIGKTQTLAFLKDPSTLAALYDDNKELRVLTTKGNFLSWEITFKASTPDPYVPGPTTTTIKWRIDIYFKRTFLTPPTLKLIDYIDQMFQAVFNHLQENFYIQEIKVSSDKIQVFLQEDRANPDPATLAIVGSIAAILLVGAFIVWKWSCVKIEEAGVKKEEIQIDQTKSVSDIYQNARTIGATHEEAMELVKSITGIYNNDDNTNWGDIALLIAVVLAAAFVGYGVLGKK